MRSQFLKYKFASDKLNSKKDVDRILLKILNPVKKFHQEKTSLGVFDDWNEYQHDAEKLKQIAQELDAGERIL